MPWKETVLMEERMRFIALERDWGGTFSELCGKFEISRKTGYKWVKRYREGATLASLQDASRRPKRSPGRTKFEIEERVVSYREKDGWGAKKLAILLSNEGIKLSVATINRIISRRNLVNWIDRHQPALSRFERGRSLELVQSDFKGPMGRDGNRNEPLSLIDDHSRTALGLYAVRNHTCDEVMPCFAQTFEEHGLPEQMLFDHGTPWWSTSSSGGITKLGVFLMKQDIELIFGRVRHPQTQGKVERFHRTLGSAVAHRFHGKGPEKPSEWQKFYDEFRYTYNNLRPHEALGMKPPSTRYKRSPRAYRTNPQPWTYPLGTTVHRVDTGGWVRLEGKRFFVSEALAREMVGIEPVADQLLVSYRRMYLREINLKTGETGSLCCPISHLT